MSEAKTTQVFLLSPRELGVPCGAAEDWFLALVFAAATRSAWAGNDIAIIGRAAIVVLAFGLAVIFAQDALETYTGIVPRFTPSGSFAIESSVAQSSVWSAIFAAVGLGVYSWRPWGRWRCFIFSVFMAIGCMGLHATEPFDWKPVIGVFLGTVVVVWLWLPDVNRRFLSSTAP